MLQHSIGNWNHLSEQDQKELRDNFDYFFQLKPAERQKVVKTLSPMERLQITTTLRKFGQLTPEQRAQCIQSFEKLAAMSESEQQQFFKNAERWEMMTQKERQDWRKLVETAPLLPTMKVYPALPQHVRTVSDKVRAERNGR